jgi:hypothetical protein
VSKGITDAMNSYENTAGKILKANPKPPKKSKMLSASSNLI